MKYDSIIIGGGLSGLMAGVKLAYAGKKTAIITSGQSALHFSSGSLGLLGSIGGETVSEPLTAIDRLPASHPYSRIGAEKAGALAMEAAVMLSQAGIRTEGSVSHCRYRLTPLGMWEPTWLSLEGLASCEHPGQCGWRKVAVINLHGYLDFFPENVADGLRATGIEAECHEINLPELARLRRSCSEMRAASIAKILRGEVLTRLASEIERVAGDADAILLPAVIGLKDFSDTDRLQAMLRRPVRYVPVIPMSVMGVRAEMMMRRYFESLGGSYLLGDSVTHGIINDGRLEAVHTANLGPTRLEADNFILATGSFFSQGLIAKPDEIIEPVFGLDVEQTPTRTDRYDKDFFAAQPYMNCGVKTDSYFRASIGGKTIDNLYASGAILAGSDSLAEGSGAGVALLTAIYVADQILSR